MNPLDQFSDFGVQPGRSDQRIIIGSGHRMYLTYEETLAWMEGIRGFSAEFGQAGIFVLPTFPAIKETGSLLEGSGILYGAQNSHWKPSGPFTGEVSPHVLRELGCTIVELGHAERREWFGETDELVRLKIRAVLEEGLVPLVCLGEPSQTTPKTAVDLVLRQLEEVLDLAWIGELSPADQASLAIMIAYEPVWAIGADQSAPLEYIKPVITALRKELRKYWPGQSAILYGGAVNPKNASSLKKSGVDGLFIGRASLDLNGFVELIKSYQ